MWAVAHPAFPGTVTEVFETREEADDRLSKIRGDFQAVSTIPMLGDDILELSRLFVDGLVIEQWVRVE